MPAPFRDFFNERYEREESSFIEVLRLGTPLLDEKTWSRLVPAVFWRGKTGLQTGIDRNPLIRFSQTSGCAPNETCWLDARVVPNTQRGYVPPDLVRSKFASLEEWLRHRYIVDVDGFGYSSGLVWKLWTQRPVFRVTSSRNLSVWYDYFLRPWLNFVPVPPGDWLAARRAFDLLEAHPCLAMAIAANARRLACVLDLDFAARLLLTSVDARFYLVADAEAGDWGGGAQVPRPLVPLLTSSFPR
ncbi:hypothetical protein CTAYLR_008382 [Chrysophaeum taylorii]|uniref:Glycosyl transferase CAP10 domain-containing protein n=1 Tax=Chrysophaeum taylorii TaxID=2483200 RepID=A0AAD7UI81_9STRA|nr:hypothetical protein CTAYLR_008382 [Chrysophaeum taylorii]